MTDLLTRAIRLAMAAHEGQLGADGLPYILHPLRVMLETETETETETEQIVAVLHDVIEDGKVHDADLSAAGFSSEIVLAVVTLTRFPPCAYADYISRCAASPLARRVKIADIRDHLAPERAHALGTRGERYRKALAVLEAAE